MGFSKRIYADYASTTPISSGASAVVRRTEKFGNPSAIHKEEIEAKKILEGARAQSARALEARLEEIVFTSGGTE